MIDLHTHSSASDGSEAPERVVELAAAAGLSALALTDHDTLEGLPAAEARAGELGLRLVRGCEVSCVSPTGTAHVLCYLVEGDEGPLQDELTRLRLDRVRRNEEMADRLARLGLPITYEEVVAEAGGVGVGRPHFAAVLVRHGAASSIEDAFVRLLGKGAPGYVPKARVEVAAIAEAAHASGALAVLAHPRSLGLEGAAFAEAIASLARKGLDGLECHYARYDPPTRSALAELAGRHGLVATGGTDFHGAYKPDLAVGRGTGDLEIPEAVLEALDERRAEVLEAPA